MSNPNPDRLEAARQALAQAEQVARADQPRPESHEPSSSGSSDRRAGRGRQGNASEGLSPGQQARQIVLRQLAVGPRTRHQLATKLADKDIPNDAAKSVLDRMTEVGLIDDEAFAHMFVRSQVDSRGLAPMALRHELRKKGVSDDLISLAVGEVEPDDQRATAQALVDKKLRTMHGLERVVQTRRLAGLLARKGYPAGLSYEVIREAIDALPPGASL